MNEGKVVSFKVEGAVETTEGEYAEIIKVHGLDARLLFDAVRARMIAAGSKNEDIVRTVYCMYQDLYDNVRNRGYTVEPVFDNHYVKLVATCYKLDQDGKKVDATLEGPR